MNLKNSYFSIPGPFEMIDKWINPFHCILTAAFANKNIRILMTRRGERALKKRCQPLNVEMQLYFSCMVKKRVLFHENSSLEYTKITEQLCLNFRSIMASACDPDEFVKKHPIKKQMSSTATDFSPSSLEIDYRYGQWCGEFYL